MILEIPPKTEDPKLKFFVVQNATINYYGTTNHNNGGLCQPDKCVRKNNKHEYHTNNIQQSSLSSFLKKLQSNYFTCKNLNSLEKLKESIKFSSTRKDKDKDKEDNINQPTPSANINVSPLEDEREKNTINLDEGNDNREKDFFDIEILKFENDNEDKTSLINNVPSFISEVHLDGVDDQSIDMSNYMKAENDLIINVDTFSQQKFISMSNSNSVASFNPTQNEEKEDKDRKQNPKTRTIQTTAPIPIRKKGHDMPIPKPKTPFKNTIHKEDGYKQKMLKSIDSSKELRTIKSPIIKTDRNSHLTNERKGLATNRNNDSNNNLSRNMSSNQKKSFQLSSRKISKTSFSNNNNNNKTLNKSIQNNKAKSITKNKQIGLLQHDSSSDEIIKELETILGEDLENFDEEILFEILEDLDLKILVRTLIFVSFEQKKKIKDLLKTVERENSKRIAISKELVDKNKAIFNLEKELDGVKNSLTQIINQTGKKEKDEGKKSRAVNNNNYNNSKNHNLSPWQRLPKTYAKGK